MSFEGTTDSPPDVNLLKKKSNPSVPGLNPNVKSLITLLRTFQFIVALLIFAFIIYTIVGRKTEISSVISILLIVNSGIYVFVLAIDLINQISGGELYGITMFVFSLLGIILFGVAAILLAFLYTAPILWYIVATLCFCLVLCILFIIDVALILVFWKRTCNLCTECCYANKVDILLKKTGPIKRRSTHETMKYDLTTSVSNLKILSGDEVAIPDHSHRKVEYGHRRQYVDCPTGARSMSNVNCGECQTEYRPSFHIESQTQRSMKDQMVQTVSRCELCNRQMQIFPTATDMQTTTQQMPCTPCPALVQLIRGVPCCPGCVTDIVQVPRQSQQQQTQQQEQEQQIQGQMQEPTQNQVEWVQPDQKSYGMLTSGQHQEPKMSGMSGTITKLTLASYCVTPSKKTPMSCQTTTDDVKTMPCTSASSEERNMKLVTPSKEKQREKKPMKKQNDIVTPEKERVQSIKTSRDMIKTTKRPTKPSIQKSAIIHTIKTSDPQTSVRSSVAESVSAREEHKPSLTESTSPQQVAQDSPQTIGETKMDDQPKETTASTLTTEILATPTPAVEEETKSQMAPESEGEAMNRAEEHEMEENQSTTETNTEQETEILFKTNATKTRGESVVSDVSTSEMTFGSVEELVSDKFESSWKPDDSITNKHVTTVEQGTLPLSKPETETQGTDTNTSLTKPKKAHLLRKKNKVEPAELTHADIDVQSSYLDDYSGRSILSTGKPEFERLFIGEKQGLGEEKDISICHNCKKLQTPPMSSSFRYYSVYKDKGGRLYCELCATANTIKILYKDGENEQKHLRCTSCRNLLRAKSSQDDKTV